MTNAIAQTTVALERVQKILEPTRSSTTPERDGSGAAAAGRDRPSSTWPLATTPTSRGSADVSFNIRPGQVVGIVGPTGSGKSTVVSLMPRFYDPSGGRVLIDGDDVSDYKLRRCATRSASCCRRRCCSAAPSPRTSPTASPARRRKRSSPRPTGERRRVHQHDAERLRDSMVGERGDTLSGGQRQRIGHRPRGDPQQPDHDPGRADRRARHRIGATGDRGADALMKGRTVIMIAHRLSTIRDADKIIVLQMAWWRRKARMTT